MLICVCSSSGCTHVVAALDEVGAQVAAHKAGAAGHQHPVALHPRLSLGLRLAVPVRLHVAGAPTLMTWHCTLYNTGMQRLGHCMSLMVISKRGAKRAACKHIMKVRIVSLSCCAAASDCCRTWRQHQSGPRHAPLPSCSALRQRLRTAPGWPSDSERRRLHAACSAQSPLHSATSCLAEGSSDNYATLPALYVQNLSPSVGSHSLSF